MDKRIAMKRAGQIALLLIAICLLVVPVLAATTTITTKIPANLTAYVTVEGQGVVYFGDTSCEASGTVTIPHNQSINLTVKPDSGWILQRALLNGEDRTEHFRTESVMLNNVTEDITFDVVFQKAASTPQTGDMGATLWIVLMCLSASGIMLLSHIRKRSGI